MMILPGQNADKIIGVFTKTVSKLGTYVDAQSKVIDKQADKILKAQDKQKAANDEVVKALNYKTKLEGLFGTVDKPDEE